jgi:tRNA(Ile)-lysidine synthase
MLETDLNIVILTQSSELSLRYNLSMLNFVRDVIQKNCFLIKDSLIILGVSGGADSLALLDLFSKDYLVVVAHFNHHLRPESSQDAQIIETIAGRYGLPCILGEGDVSEFAQANHFSIEEAAREMRYRFLFKQAENFKAQAVAVAHHADDQVETVLMHLLRGTGLDGLSGMAYRSLPNPWSSAIPLVRPFLQTWRLEIENYCAEKKISPLTDSTNVDITYFRNRIRKNLIPELEAYVPGFRKRLWRTADLIRNDRIILEGQTENAWQAAVVKREKNYVVFHCDIFNNLPLSLKRRLIRKAIFFLRQEERDVDFELVKSAIVFSLNPSATMQADLGLGLRVSIEQNQLIISDWNSDLPISQWPQLVADCMLDVPGELDLGNGWILKAELPLDKVSAKNDARNNQDPYQAWVNWEDRELMLLVRRRTPGDRIQPLGMSGRSMKISDLMVNEKVPRRARAGWPLICVNDEIIWLPGYRLSHSFRVTNISKSVVKLSLNHQCRHIPAK